MNLLKLQYFIDIADCRSISAAARKNFIAQQSMSSALRSLERFYNVRLFTRTSPLQLTETGQRLYTAAKQAIAAMDEFRAGLTQAEKPLILGLDFDSTPPFLAELLAKVNADRDSPIDIRLLTAPPIDDADLHIGMTPPEGCDSVILLHDTSVVVASRDLIKQTYGSDMDTVLAQVTASQNLYLLHKLPFAVIENNDSMPPFMQGLNIAARCNRGDLTRELCSRGHCALLIGGDYARRDFSGRDDILILPVNVPEMSIVLYIYYKTGRALSSEAQRFLLAATEFFASPEQTGRVSL